MPLAEWEELENKLRASCGDRRAIGGRDGRLNTLWGRLLVEELPGAAWIFSALARLALDAADRGRRGGACSAIVDERGALHALGHARRPPPAALVCTSGTAVANYLPAVVEAAQDGVPLVVITADRPPELIDAGANQAIKQPGIFGEYVRWSFTLPAPDAAISGRLVLSTVDQALHRALGPPAGPVHVNCLFREPLEPAGEAPWPEDIPRRWREGRGPLTTYARAEAVPDAGSLDRIAASIGAARRGLLVLGSLPRTPTARPPRRRRPAGGRRRGHRSGLRLGAGPRRVTSTRSCSARAALGVRADVVCLGGQRYPSAWRRPWPPFGRRGGRGAGAPVPP
jgi:hypothetical protein